jgi:hypothetical protein
MVSTKQMGQLGTGPGWQGSSKKQGEHMNISDVRCAMPVTSIHKNG